jgi:hypothetical protein
MSRMIMPNMVVFPVARSLTLAWRGRRLVVTVTMLVRRMKIWLEVALLTVALVFPTHLSVSLILFY